MKTGFGFVKHLNLSQFTENWCHCPSQTVGDLLFSAGNQLE